MEFNNITSEVVASNNDTSNATILYGEQLTLWDSLDEAAPETTQTDEATPETTQVDRVTAKAKPLDDSCTLVVVAVAFPAIVPLAEKRKPP